MGRCGASGQKTKRRWGKIVDDISPPINESLMGEYTRHKRQMETEKKKSLKVWRSSIIIQEERNV